MSLSTKTLQFGTTETIPTILFKDQRLEDGKVPSQSEPLIPDSPLTSKTPAQVHVKVEHFEAVTNTRETEAKTDTTTSTSTTTATNTDSDKENQTPYTPTSVSPEQEYTYSDVGRGLCLLYNSLHTYYGPPRPQTSFERYSGPTWTDDEEKVEVQWVKKLSQCLAVLERLTCRKTSKLHNNLKTSKLHNNLKIIYEILGYLGFQTSPILYDLG